MPLKISSECKFHLEMCYVLRIFPRLFKTGLDYCVDLVSRLWRQSHSLHYSVTLRYHTFSRNFRGCKDFLNLVQSTQRRHHRPPVLPTGGSSRSEFTIESKDMCPFLRLTEKTGARFSGFKALLNCKQM